MTKKQFIDAYVSISLENKFNRYNPQERAMLIADELEKMIPFDKE